MKSLGIVRKLDKLGRIVLPIETRKSLDLDTDDGVEMFIDQDKLILKKYQPCCIFCGDAENIVYFKEKRVCRNCLTELNNILK